VHVVFANIFQPLIDAFEDVLIFFHDQGGISWGWAIVLMTVMVRMVLLPLTFKQMKSMQRLQHLSPQLKELQKKYKQDKERLNQETMKFYRENNVNPLASCLPLVLQLPVFVGLYYMLRKDLRADVCPHVQHLHQLHTHSTDLVACGSANPHSGFLFIPDITHQATGAVLVGLLILYVATQVTSMYLGSMSADPKQRKIMMFLPFVFVAFIFRFPAGLLVYWITTNLWTVVQGIIVRRTVGPIRPPRQPAGADGKGAGGSGSAGGAPKPAAGKPAAGLSSNGSSNGDGRGGGMREKVGRAVRGEVTAPEPPPRKPAKAPPPPPRRKKKRSGRRR
jgi:YidC/Oxa1 family membrane protein insertase